MLLCGLLAIGVQKLTKPVAISAGSTSVQQFLTKDHGWSKAWDSFWIIGAFLLVIPPLLMVLLSGINQQVWTVLTDERFWSALSNSLKVAGLASALAVAAGVSILLTSRRWRLQYKNTRADQIELIGTIILVTPGLVISTGLFLLLRSFTDVFSLAFFVVILVNGLMALPYVIKTLAQPMLHIEQQYQYVCASLGMRAGNDLKWWNGRRCASRLHMRLRSALCLQ